MSQRISQSTIRMTTPPSIKAFAAVVGKKEGEGPLGRCFDIVNDDTTFGEKTWEKSESRMQTMAVSKLLEKAALSTPNVDVIFAGDLLNQCIGSTYGLRDLEIPFLGVFGACSTMAEGLCLASLFADNGIATNAVAVTSSHFCTAERQFRLPLEYGGQRPPTAQWTVTGSGALLVTNEQLANAPKVRTVTIGKITDKGIKDANNMGAAMAPAACSTIKAYFDDTREQVESFDAIVTGDLGDVGSKLLLDLLKREGLDISSRHTDCGMMIYNNEEQDTHAGASGCGCSASVLCGYFLPRLMNGQLKKILFCATGALMSPTSAQQGESIPGICHAVEITAE